MVRGVMAAVVGALLVDVDGEVEAGVGVGGEGDGEGHCRVNRRVDNGR